MYHSKKTRVQPFKGRVKTRNTPLKQQINHQKSVEKSKSSRKKYIAATIMGGMGVCGLFAVAIVVPLVYSLNASKNETTTTSATTSVTTAAATTTLATISATTAGTTAAATTVGTTATTTSATISATAPATTVAATTTSATTPATTSVATTTGSNFTPSSATCSSTAATSCTTTTSIIANCQSYEVSWNNHCYYLDGSGGSCIAGYIQATNGVMTCINTQFAGKTYRSTISNNCCVWTADTYECYGLGSNCNTAGPFTSGPTINGAGCANLQLNNTQQLTFCGSI